MVFRMRCPRLNVSNATFPRKTTYPTIRHPSFPYRPTLRAFYHFDIGIPSAKAVRWKCVRRNFSFLLDQRQPKVVILGSASNRLTICRYPSGGTPHEEVCIGFPVRPVGRPGRRRPSRRSLPTERRAEGTRSFARRSSFGACRHRRSQHVGPAVGRSRTLLLSGPLHAANAVVLAAENRRPEVRLSRTGTHRTLGFRKRSAQLLAERFRFPLSCFPRKCRA